MRHGLDPTRFVDGANAHNRFIYASSPTRGLEQLLQQWPTIYDALSGNATLEVYYGFSPAVVQHVKTLANGERWLARMHKLLEQPGVRYVGMVDHDTLAHAYAAAGFFLYPTSYPETGCFALMKAMVMGAVPVTSRFIGSAVHELTEEFGVGPPARRGSISTDPAWQREWAEAVVAAAKSDLSAHRAAMKRWARGRFQWAKQADLWADMMFTDLQSTPLSASPDEAAASVQPLWAATPQ